MLSKIVDDEVFYGATIDNRVNETEVAVVDLAFDQNMKD